jgi:hypothetical protein
MSTKHDLAIRWSGGMSAVRKLRRAGAVPIHAYPRHFRCPGGVVAIVSGNNEIKLTFRATAIDGPLKVTLADGKKWRNGYIIRSDKRTLRLPKRPTPAPIRGWHAIGAFRYFDAAKMRAILVGDNFGLPGEYIANSTNETSDILFRPYVYGIPGLPRNHPETILVDRYVSWMDENARFGNNYIPEAKLFVDLFDLTHWQLLEAKATTSREAIRMAIGQLRDYKRYYSGRHPSLAVLLSSHPTVSCIKLLTDNRIAAIWRTPGGSFRTRRWQELHQQVAQQ